MTSTPSPLDLDDNRTPREWLEDAREKIDRLLAEDRIPADPLMDVVHDVSGAAAELFRREEGDWTVSKAGDQWQVEVVYRDRIEEVTVEADDQDDVEEFAQERLTEFRDEANI